MAMPQNNGRQADVIALPGAIVSAGLPSPGQRLLTELLVKKLHGLIKTDEAAAAGGP